MKINNNYNNIEKYVDNEFCGTFYLNKSDTKLFIKLKG